VKLVLQYLAENLYQVDKVFVDWFELNSDFFAALSTKKEELKGKYKYKRAA
jgi:hypothetical protein